jgi:hypothetical protein
MGQNLDKAIVDLKVNARKLLETSKRHFQVWELEEKQLDKLDAVPDNDWKREWGWWRKAESCFTGNETINFMVRGREMKGYKNRFYSDSDGTGEVNIVDKQYPYVSFQDWLFAIMNLSNDTNTVAVASSLAIDNHMTLAEFIEKYQD